MPNAARENCVFAVGKTAGSKYAILALWILDNWPAGNGFCLIGARGKGSCVQGETGRVSHRALRGCSITGLYWELECRTAHIARQAGVLYVPTSVLPVLFDFF